MSMDWRSRLATELASEVLFDEGVEAARNACVAGAPIAAAAITAAAWYSNPFTGLPALRACMRCLARLPMSLSAWQDALRQRTPRSERVSAYAPGFGFVSPLQARWLLKACRRLLGAENRSRGPGRKAFFLRHTSAICRVSGPLNHAGLAAMHFVDHDGHEDEAERWYLLCRLSVAMQEAERARRNGLANFPFFERDYLYEGRWPKACSFDLADLRRRVGV